MKAIHFPLRVDGSYMDTLVNPIMDKKSVFQDHCYFKVCTSGESPNPRPGPSDILQIAFASVSFLDYFFGLLSASGTYLFYIIFN